MATKLLLYCVANGLALTLPLKGVSFIANNRQFAMIVANSTEAVNTIKTFTKKQVITNRKSSNFIEYVTCIIVVSGKQFTWLIRFV